MDGEKLVYAPSSSLYGDTSTLPKREDMCRLPISPYGIVNLDYEAYMQGHHKINGLKTISLR